MNSETRPLIFSLLTVLLWGLWGFFGKLALEKRMPATTIFLAETLISALIAMVLILVLVQKHDAQASLYSTVNVYGILSGVVLALGLLFYYLALQDAHVTVIVPVTATYPVVAVLLGYIVLRERPSPLQWVGVMFVIVGVVLLLSGPSKASVLRD